MLRCHQDDLVNHFRMPVHNGAVEGLNKTKEIGHKAYGLRTAKSYSRNFCHCVADLPLPKTMRTFV